MSVLIDELEARKNDYILVGHVIDLIAEATNSSINDVILYLESNNIDEHLSMFYLTDLYGFESYNSSFGQVAYSHDFGKVDSEANSAYFLKSAVLAFEPIIKHKIFDNESYKVNQYAQNLNDKYLTVNEAASLLAAKTSSPYNYTLKDLARMKKITPCFYFHGYVCKLTENHKGSFDTDFEAILSAELMTGYFTYSLLTEEIIIYEDYIKLPFCQAGNEIKAYRIFEKQSKETISSTQALSLFTAEPQAFSNENSKLALSYIDHNELRFSERELNVYIESIKLKENCDNKQTLQSNEESKKELESLKNENADLNSRLLIARQTFKQQKNEINALKEQLNQAQAELTNSPTDAVELKGLDKYNVKKAMAIATAKAIAKYIWSMDNSQAIRTGDMVQQIRHVMHNIEPKLLPDDKAIRAWLSDIAPDYATKGGKPPKDAPNEIPLIMKK